MHLQLRPISLIVFLLMVADFLIAQEPGKEGIKFNQMSLKLNLIRMQLDSLNNDSVFILLGDSISMQDKGFNFNDSGYKNIRNQLKGQATSIFKRKSPARSEKGKLAQPWVQWGSTTLRYDYQFRSKMDTGWIDHDFASHNLTVATSLVLGGYLPVSASYWMRRTNSPFYRDLNDFRISIDPSAYGTILGKALTKNVNRYVDDKSDSVMAGMLQRYANREQKVRRWLDNPLNKQKLLEAQEILAVKKLSWNSGLDSVDNAQRADSMQAAAKAYVNKYMAIHKGYDRIRMKSAQMQETVDSLRRNEKMIREALSEGSIEALTRAELRSRLEKIESENVKIPKSLKWLLGLQKFSIGRDVANYSELTMKNISIRGINFEYNSWYYLALSAGTVDYQLRGYEIRSYRQPLQYAAMFRFGLGQREGDHLILSAFKGRKRAYWSNGNTGSNQSYDITGASLEGRIQINRTSYLTTEVAESFAPDFEKQADGEKAKIGLADRSNKAVAMHLYSFLPRHNMRIEGLYRSMGRNYQSFTGYQSNSASSNWYVKLSKQFLRNRLQATVSLRNAGYANPMIVQKYASNTLFKSIGVRFRQKKWPIFSASWMPMSQFTKLGDTLLESKFQSLNLSAYHFYKIAAVSANTSILFNRFYNSMSDTGFVYFDSRNINIIQSFFFRKFSAFLSGNITQNSQFKLVVLDEKIVFNNLKGLQYGLGFKINVFGRGEQIVRAGYYGSVSGRLGAVGNFSISVDKGFMPGYKGGLIKNDFIMAGFSRAFR